MMMTMMMIENAEVDPDLVFDWCILQFSYPPNPFQKKHKKMKSTFPINISLGIYLSIYSFPICELVRDRGQMHMWLEYEDPSLLHS